MCLLCWMVLSAGGPQAAPPGSLDVAFACKRSSSCIAFDNWKHIGNIVRLFTMSYVCRNVTGLRSAVFLAAAAESIKT
jgi:hypothetical protein